MKRQERYITVSTGITFVGVLAVGAYLFQIGFEFSIVLIPLTVFVVLLSDVFDGFFARRLNQKTFFGQFLDFFRDRFFLIVAMGNLVLIRKGTLILFFFFVLILSQLIFFFKDIKDFRERREKKETLLTKLSFALSFIMIMVMVIMVYWFNLESGIPLFVALFVFTSLVEVGKWETPQKLK